jgi:hypothetical protein
VSGDRFKRREIGGRRPDQERYRFAAKLLSLLRCDRQRGRRTPEHISTLDKDVRTA